MDDEIVEVYGEHIYHDVGLARIQATITNTDDALFLPASYGINEVRFLEGQTVELTEIRTFEGLFGKSESHVSEWRRGEVGKNR